MPTKSRHPCSNEEVCGVMHWVQMGAHDILLPDTQCPSLEMEELYRRIFLYFHPATIAMSHRVYFTNQVYIAISLWQIYFFLFLIVYLLLSEIWWRNESTHRPIERFLPKYLHPFYFFWFLRLWFHYSMFHFISLHMLPYTHSHSLLYSCSPFLLIYIACIYIHIYFTYKHFSMYNITVCFLSGLILRLVIFI